MSVQQAHATDEQSETKVRTCSRFWLDEKWCDPVHSQSDDQAVKKNEPCPSLTYSEQNFRLSCFGSCFHLWCAFYGAYNVDCSAEFFRVVCILFFIHRHFASFRGRLTWRGRPRLSG